MNFEFLYCAICCCCAFFCIEIKLVHKNIISGIKCSNSLTKSTFLLHKLINCNDCQVCALKVDVYGKICRNFLNVALTHFNLFVELQNYLKIILACLFRTMRFAKISGKG